MKISGHRAWTLRRDNSGHHHGVVDLSESPLLLHLSWRANDMTPPEYVGVFTLDLNQLLRDKFIRHEPVGSKGSSVRLRVVMDDAGDFYVQARSSGPRFPLLVES
ncbi:MAG TPA: hypothetical protein VK171_00090 [Fimbriimonas sp.]|nr:hypothetical protein [Fimbriimonas sp.]